jgi:transketolase C-terminal domain/subunit
VSELPLHALSTELQQSIAETGKLLVVEEHVQRGGLGEHLALLLLESGVRCKLFHHCARGYENGQYGSQNYHQKQNQLDKDALRQTITNILSK